MEIRTAGSCSGPAADKLCDFRPGSSPPQMSFSSAVNKDRLDSMLAIVPFSPEPIRIPSQWALTLRIPLL